ncbi:FUSC family protein [Mycolicibacterium sp. HK-90]|uniref:FUSC family protein n=1 Tax=Mycolicibacterium sp. HK-90 TaxID=3056937 RepID=UPI002659D718|nr:FUSC family protein [Mycolicibacterium sp. HK-90]WKG05680.1 FUSC family protein [Mycolicibacterium sp. HK-90]
MVRPRSDGSAMGGGRIRTPELLRPVGSSRWGMAAALAVALGAVLTGTALFGRAEWGSAVGLGFVLIAVPEIPTTWRSALHTMGIRAATVVVGGVLVVAGAHNAIVLAGFTVLAAITGALIPGVGATAGLAVVLMSIDLDQDATSMAALWPYLVGIAIVFASWVVWFAISRLRHRIEEEPLPPSSAAGVAHAARVGVAVGLAVSVAALLPADMVGGHWLVTSVLLTIQPSQAETGLRLAQRLSGNAVGAVIAAALLGTHPSAPVVIGLTVVLFLMAMALRPVNYTWWAIAGPPVLLVISEYPDLFPWYEGAVRLAMNFVGALIVALMVFVVPSIMPTWLRQR